MFAAVDQRGCLEHEDYVSCWYLDHAWISAYITRQPCKPVVPTGPVCTWVCFLVSGTFCMVCLPRVTFAAHYHVPSFCGWCSLITVPCQFYQAMSGEFVVLEIRCITVQMDEVWSVNLHMSAGLGMNSLGNMPVLHTHEFQQTYFCSASHSIRWQHEIKFWQSSICAALKIHKQQLSVIYVSKEACLGDQAFHKGNCMSHPMCWLRSDHGFVWSWVTRLFPSNICEQ